MRRLLKRQGFAPRTMVTDKWRAYAAAIRELGLTARHHQAKWKNNRIESSHVPIRIRERKMQRFRSIGSTQRFLSVHAAVYNTFNTRRHLITASEHRKRRNNAFRQWREAVAVGV
jgi:putative transposase